MAVVCFVVAVKINCLQKPNNSNQLWNPLKLIGLSNWRNYVITMLNK